MEQNNNERKKSFALIQAVQTITSIAGYIVGSVLIGIYLDKKFFNNGISVIVMLLFGTMLAFYHIIRLVIVSSDRKN